ncbi:hypothetical protein D3C75_1332450 [compost metagenome]
MGIREHRRRTIRKLFKDCAPDRVLVIFDPAQVHQGFLHPLSRQNRTPDQLHKRRCAFVCVRYLCRLFKLLS